MDYVRLSLKMLEQWVSDELSWFNNAKEEHQSFASFYQKMGVQVLIELL